MSHDFAPRRPEDALAVFGPRLAQIYGQGETPVTITALSKADHGDRDHPRWSDRLQSVGLARTDVEVGVVDDSGRQLPTDEIGEVIVRGDVVMTAYWNRPEATAETLRDGWLHTGDLGSFDADGYLTTARYSSASCVNSCGPTQRTRRTRIPKSACSSNVYPERFVQSGPATFGDGELALVLSTTEPPLFKKSAHQRGGHGAA